MNRVASIAASATALAILTLSADPAMAGGSAGTWPTAYPLPTDPGILTAQTSTTAVVRSTDPVLVVQHKLDNLYLTQNGCTLQLGMNKPRSYLCHNSATGKTDEILFTFAALDPTPSDPALSQTNAFYHQG